MPPKVDGSVLVVRLAFYMLAGITAGSGAWMLWGAGAFFITLGAVLLLWCMMVDVSGLITN